MAGGGQGEVAVLKHVSAWAVEDVDAEADGDVVVEVLPVAVTQGVQVVHADQGAGVVLWLDAGVILAISGGFTLVVPGAEDFPLEVVEAAADVREGGDGVATVAAPLHTEDSVLVARWLGCHDTVPGDGGGAPVVHNTVTPTPAGYKKAAST